VVQIAAHLAPYLTTSQAILTIKKYVFIRISSNSAPNSYKFGGKIMRLWGSHFWRFSPRSWHQKA